VVLHALSVLNSAGHAQIQLHAQKKILSETTPQVKIKNKIISLFFCMNNTTNNIFLLELNTLSFFLGTCPFGSFDDGYSCINSTYKIPNKHNIIRNYVGFTSSNFQSFIIPPKDLKLFGNISFFLSFFIA